MPTPLCQKLQTFLKMKVTPKSAKAKNRFANLMDRDPNVFVEQIKGDRVFVRSANGKNFFWFNLTNDPHWNNA